MTKVWGSEQLTGWSFYVLGETAGRARVDRIDSVVGRIMFNMSETTK